MAGSGTELLKQYGEQHVRTGRPIVYTSADSVFQIAAHEAVIELDELYRMCGIARKLLTGAHNVQRVIARPFVGGSTDGFTRTEHRRDYPVAPPEPNVLSVLEKAGKRTRAIGVISGRSSGAIVSRGSSVCSRTATTWRPLKQR